ncbi:hypothetical protein RHMOL_Rhmol11G0066100 [Rhododendron molle]|uniref:Uncharacterized protein n=1 Tax=Rhododendron molle TaxID=49168 RepID=A0ACC0LQA8_RHOML|nr:hypothetical protein RHMOL_Rhmol11G0066100 [Rhododendron molle]
MVLQSRFPLRRGTSCSLRIPGHLDALEVDRSAADVLRGVGSPEGRVVATLLGAQRKCPKASPSQKRTASRGEGITEDVAVVTGGAGKSDGGIRVEFGSAVAVVGDIAATGGVGNDTGASNRGTTSEGPHPHTPTVEDLLKAVDEGGSSGQEAAADSKAAIVGRFAAKPILRTSTVEPRGKDNEISASERIHFAAGDFFESTNPGTFWMLS